MARTVVKLIYFNLGPNASSYKKRTKKDVVQFLMGYQLMHKCFKLISI